MRSGSTCMPSTMRAELAPACSRRGGSESGRIDALDRRVRDVALVPQRDVLEPGLRGCRAARGPDRCSCSAVIGLRLCGIAELSPSAPGRGTAPRPRAPRCAAGGGPRWRTSSIVAPTRRAGVELLGVAVAGDHLRGRHRLRARALAHVRARPRDRCWSRCRPRPTACRRRPRPGPRARRSRSRSHLQRPERELGAERGGLGVDAVGAADHRRCRGARGPARVIAASSASTRAEQRGRAHRERPATRRCRRRRYEVSP